MSDDLQKAGEGFWARINHPVIGVFITSSVFWNWEILYYLFRGLGTTQETVTFVNSQFLRPENWKNLVLIPAGLTFGFLIVAPALQETYSNYKIW